MRKSIKDGKMEVVTEQNEKNRPKYLIPVSSLPEELKGRYYKRKQQELGLHSEVKEPETPSEQRSKAVKKPVAKKRLDEFT